MDEKKYTDDAKAPATVPYMVYEGEMARNERHMKWLIITVVVSVILLFLSNAIWLKAWTAYDYVSEEVATSVDIDAEDGGDANYIGRDGDIINGTNTSENS